MTGETTVRREAPAAARGRPATLRALYGLSRTYRQLAWGAAGVAVLAAALGWVFGLITGAAESSVWEHTGTPLRWMLLVLGSMITSWVMPTYIAHGITRRAFGRATAIGGVGLAALVAGFLAAGYLVERAVFQATGRPYQLAAEHLFDSVHQVHLVFVEHLLAGTAYLVSGWLLGTCYHRFGGLRGTLALPLGLLPAAAVDNLLGVGQWLTIGPPGLGMFTPGLPPPVAVTLAVAVIAVAFAVVQALIRNVPVPVSRRSR